MIIKSLLWLFGLFIFASGDESEYIYNKLAGGWFKVHLETATRDDATSICSDEDAVLASPLSVLVRDAVKNLTSVADASIEKINIGVYLEYYSSQGVPLAEMPVTMEGANKTLSCVAWIMTNDTVVNVECEAKMPFVCFKQTKSIAIGCGTADQGYAYNSRIESCYKFHKHGQTWSNASDTCQKEGSYLAIINSAAENEVLTNLFASNPPEVLTNTDYPNSVFLGFSRVSNTIHENYFYRRQVWKTVQGQTLAEAGYDIWDFGEPNDVGDIEKCGSLARRGNFNDVPCFYTYAFICEKQPEILQH